MNKEKSYEFYKEFYEDNRVKLLIYENLRTHFNKVVEDVLGKDYYNTEMDNYECDRVCCEHITSKLKPQGFFSRVFK